MVKEVGGEQRYYVRPVEVNEFSEWNALVDRSVEGSVYARADYLEVLATVTSNRFEVLGVFDGSRLVGGIPLFIEGGRPSQIVRNRLLLQYNGPVTDPGETKYPSIRTSRIVRMCAAIESALSGRCFGRIALRFRPPLSDVRVFAERGWKTRLGYTYEMPLTALRDGWERVEKNLRRLILRCEDLGMQLVEAGNSDMFYRLHEETSRRKGAPLYLPRDCFEHYLRELRARGLARLYEACLPGGDVLATQLVLASKHPVTHTVAAAADLERRGVGASAFLRWRVFEQLAADGYAANDLTDAALGSVTHFKSQFGGMLLPTVIIERQGPLRAQIRSVSRALISHIQRAVGRRG